jgi:membrane-associated phospholipid phosphatase
MWELIKNNRWYFVSALIYFIVSTLLLLFYPKGVVEIKINQSNHPALDIFFYYTTAIGNGWTAAVFILILLLFVNIYWAIISCSAILLSTILIQLFKYYLFKDVVRPIVFLEPHKNMLHFVEGVHVNSFNSFPSGHTVQAACLTLCMALCIPNKKQGVFLFFICILVGLSRVYLLQHFLIDTYFGTWIGLIVAFFTYYFFEKYAGLKNNNSLQKGLLLAI